ncbi:MAG: hypothetical protein GOMPHAMPRED_007507 [Gomphillus americanus]|uniref:F-box domain-containing protein n=1 Tax=Gomphillus americanus TaxID=1940652 RepID=A0A8H3EWT1_9LECA|nr:MAG: hypothetical protein GOMPHAMPRED_007507 [Gomphillus americanus]
MENETTQSGTVTPNSPAAPKLKGRQRILQSLQRISSQPSLAIMGRSSSGYNGTGKASMSCMSLSSSTMFSSSLGLSHSTSTSSQLSAHLSTGFSTAPTSVPGTPDPNMGCLDLFMKGARPVDDKYAPSGSTTPITAPLPPHLVLNTSLRTSCSLGQLGEDYFSLPASRVRTPLQRPPFNIWKDMPDEIKVRIFTFLSPKEIVRCSAVSRQWHKMCFDGQLWTALDASPFYRNIPSKTLFKIITSAGPFVKDLNLRGCIQMRDYWNAESERIAEVCTNLENFSIEGCRIDRGPLHIMLLRNSRLISINLQGLKVVNNTTLRLIGQNCPQLEYLDVSWCQHADAKGLTYVVQGCSKLRDLRASEVKGFQDEELLLALFERNTLERLMVAHCTDLTDEGLSMLLHGKDPETDVLTDTPLTPPRTFKHLDLSRCRALTDASVKLIALTCPDLVGLRLSQCTSLTDDAVLDVIENAKYLTHLDVEELTLTNQFLINLSKSPCVSRLTHLNVSYCEELGDTGMLPLIKAGTSLFQLDMDNTRISDLCLTEAAAQMRIRNEAAFFGNIHGKPVVGMNLVVYDCQNVTWMGVREVMSRNAEFFRRIPPCLGPTYPKEIISLKCFYGYQPTVNEHTKRVLRGELARATLLERKWAYYMMATEEAGAGGSGWRRRRRRLREAERVHADETEELRGGGGGRRRARSGGCVVM